MGQQVGVAGGAVDGGQPLRRRPRRMGPVRQRLGGRDVGLAADRVEDDPHRVDGVEVRARRVAVDGDPLLVRLVADWRIGRDVVRPAVDGRLPAARAARPLRADRDGDDLLRHGRVHGVVSDVEVMATVGVVVELVAEDELVEVPVAVEGADRVGVVRPALKAGDVALARPGLAAVGGLVEAEHVVVALRAHEPLRGADQVVGSLGVDDQVRLRVALDQLRHRGRVAGRAAGLGGITTERLAGGRPPGAVFRTAVALSRLLQPVGHLRRVTARLLGRGEDVRHLRHLAAPSERRIAGEPGR